MALQNVENIYIRKFSEFSGIQGKLLSDLKFVVKDVISIESYPVTFGLKPPFKEKSIKTAHVVKHLLNHGAALIGTTNLDPGAMGITGKNPYYGDMKNPIDSGLPLGGSSGGAAAAVSSGDADFAVVSDHGGSARMPASLCSISGLKLSSNFLDQSDCILLDDDLDSLGLIGANPNILERVLLTFPLKNNIELQTRKLFIPIKSDLDLLDKSAKEEFQDLIFKLKNSFEINELGIELRLNEMAELRKIIISRLFLEQIKSYGLQNLPEDLRAIVKYAQGLTVTEYSKAMEKIFEFRVKVRTILTNTALLCPLLPTSKNLIETFQGRVNLFMIFANLCGLPAINIERPRNSQLVGPEFSEISLCKLAGNLGNM